MGIQAIRYLQRKLAGMSGAGHELEFYYEPEVLLWPRPCWCEWSHLQDRLLGLPERDGLPCACAGPVSFNVPGYPDAEETMRCFAQKLESPR